MVEADRYYILGLTNKNFRASVCPWLPSTICSSESRTIPSGAHVQGYCICYICWICYGFSVIHILRSAMTVCIHCAFVCYFHCITCMHPHYFYLDCCLIHPLLIELLVLSLFALFCIWDISPLITRHFCLVLLCLPLAAAVCIVC